MANPRWTLLPSPVGDLHLGADDDALTDLWFPAVLAHPDREAAGRRVEVDADPLLGAAAAELAEYFRGERTVFGVLLEPHGTAFERSVWRRLLDIPYGETVTYGEVARDVGEPGGAQAVGRAVGANPIGILVPCHRVIGVDGSMTGFAGGLVCKTALLDLEGYTCGTTLLPPTF